MYSIQNLPCFFVLKYKDFELEHCYNHSCKPHKTILPKKSSLRVQGSAEHGARVSIVVNTLGAYAERNAVGDFHIRRQHTGFQSAFPC